MAFNLHRTCYMTDHHNNTKSATDLAAETRSSCRVLAFAFTLWPTSVVICTGQWYCNHAQLAKIVV